MRTAKLFRNGQSQAVRLPREFRMTGTEVHIRKVGNAVILLPTERSWDTLIQSLDLFSDDFLAQRKQPKHQKRKELFR